MLGASASAPRACARDRRGAELHSRLSTLGSDHHHRTRVFPRVTTCCEEGERSAPRSTRSWTGRSAARAACSWSRGRRGSARRPSSTTLPNGWQRAQRSSARPVANPARSSLLGASPTSSVRPNVTSGTSRRRKHMPCAVRWGLRRVMEASIVSRSAWQRSASLPAWARAGPSSRSSTISSGWTSPRGQRSSSRRAGLPGFRSVWSWARVQASCPRPSSEGFRASSSGVSAALMPVLSSRLLRAFHSTTPYVGGCFSSPKATLSRSWSFQPCCPTLSSRARTPSASPFLSTGASSARSGHGLRGFPNGRGQRC